MILFIQVVTLVVVMLFGLIWLSISTGGKGGSNKTEDVFQLFILSGSPSGCCSKDLHAGLKTTLKRFNLPCVML